MTQTDSRRGGANMAPLLMVVSFAAIAGFLYWLGTTAEATQPMIVEADTASVFGDEGAVEVTGGQLYTDPAAYDTMFIRVSDVGVSDAVGSQAFHIETGPAGISAPFLVKMDSTLIARGQRLPTGRVTVAGRLRAMTDSIVSAWIDEGVVAESDEIVLKFSSYFLEASVVRTPDGAMSPGGGDGGEAGSGDGS